MIRSRRLSVSPLPPYAALAAAVLAVLAVGCTPHIGGSCTLNTDCSIDNSKQCDNAQAGGYCTVFNCSPNTCPDNAVCVELQANVPGCPYDDYASPSRSGRSMCLKSCNHDSDCRQGEGYVCRSMMDIRNSGIEAVILDDNQSQKVCVLPAEADGGTGNLANAASVCPGSPLPEAGVIPTNDSGAAPSEAGADAGSDAALDATVTDAPADVAPVDAADATVDGPGLADAAAAEAGDAGEGDAAADSAAGG
jgi:hypothetical protein